MTRFMMTLEEAIDLVLFAFEHGENGDIFVQKAPAATIDVLAQAIQIVMGVSDHPLRVMGTRHGEKLYETLLSAEEMASAADLGKYFRVAPDRRDLNYSKFIEEGEAKISESVDYNSHTTTRLDVNGMVKLLHELDFVAQLKAGQPPRFDL